MKKLKLEAINIQTFVTSLPSEIAQKIYGGGNTNDDSGVNTNCTIVAGPWDDDDDDTTVLDFGYTFDPNCTQARTGCA